MHTKTKPLLTARKPTTSLFGPVFVLLAAFTILAAACGSDPEEIVAGAGGQDDSEQVEQADDEGADDTTDDEAAGAGDSEDEDQSDDVMALTPSESHPELVSGQPALISEVVAIDGQTLGVRYEGAAEPCAMANATVTETDASIEVSLETGLNPNAAAMSCIAQVFSYEIQVALDQPIGDREVIVVAP